jgi:hypothetical protein
VREISTCIDCQQHSMLSSDAHTCQYEEDAEARKTHVAVDKPSVLQRIKAWRAVVHFDEDNCLWRCTSAMLTGNHTTNVPLA